MPRRSTPRHVHEARRLPHHVDLPNPSGGLGQRLDELMDWCRAHVGGDRWFAYGGRFMFADAADAARFRLAAGL